MTIHCSVPVELDLDGMRTQEPDVAACRELFCELEFTTLLKELAPAVDNTPRLQSRADTRTDRAVLSTQRSEKRRAYGLALAIFDG